MSRKKETIIIEPPAGMGYENARTETFRSGVFDCPVCNGMGGWHYDAHSVHGERWEVCSMCKGSGKIQAHITHTWVGTGDIKEQFRDYENSKQSTLCDLSPTKARISD